ncbi:hypothetical protein WN51_07075 [Melipona quadrifasciata]|uniref:Uncharacterized protein n=1 Tax=Melipona quadrifasciata TaxID=166423 RepID=A0A0M8ZPL4_9HYME|nr:hypothetical protein WN51_07075 [Melipona quadrifasciata]
MCKTPKIQLDNSISYINSNKTPGKSILKQKNSNETECVKSTNKINFNDHVILNEVSIDEETQTKVDLTQLSTIDNFDFDSTDEVNINVEKKLDFDDNEQHETTRILRNRTITSTDTPKLKRRSSRKMSINVQETEHKETVTPIDKRKRRSRFKLNTNERNDIELLCRNCDDISLDKSKDKRKSTKSVKFSEKEYSDETNKPILPLTPYIKRSKSSKSRSRSNSIHVEISTSEMEEKPLQRVTRRSQNKKLLSPI